MDKYDVPLDVETEGSCSSYILRQIKENSRVLEFGAAHGRMTKYIKEKLHCTVDIVEYDLASGTDAAKFADTALIGEIDGDINKFIWEKKLAGQYDYIIFADVLEHLPHPYAVFKACVGKLHDDGMILVSLPNVANNAILIELYRDEFPYAEVGLLDSTHIQLFANETFKKKINDYGLYIDEMNATIADAGQNEFLLGFGDIPYALARELKSREFGAVYQYIYTLRKITNENEIPPIKNHISKTVGYYASYDAGDAEGTDKKAIVMPLFPVLGKHTLRLTKFSDGAAAVQVSLINANSIIVVKSVTGKTANGYVATDYVAPDAVFVNGMYIVSAGNFILVANLPGNEKITELIMEYEIISYDDDNINRLYAAYSSRGYKVLKICYSVRDFILRLLGKNG